MRKIHLTPEKIRICRLTSLMAALVAIAALGIANLGNPNRENFPALFGWADFMTILPPSGFAFIILGVTGGLRLDYGYTNPTKGNSRMAGRGACIVYDALGFVMTIMGYAYYSSNSVMSVGDIVWLAMAVQMAFLVLTLVTFAVDLMHYIWDSAKRLDHTRRYISMAEYVHRVQQCSDK